MSLEEELAKFPGPIYGIPPSPTRENPAAVFPKTDPAAGTIPKPHRNGIEKYAGNPFMMERALRKLDESIQHVIEILEDEEKAQGDSPPQNALLAKLHVWKRDMELIMEGKNNIDNSLYEREEAELQGIGSEDRGGGMFID